MRAQWDEATAEELEANRVTVAVAGRIMAIRAQGKAGFATLQQGGERLQIYVRLDAVGEQGFALYKLLDLGDHIGVTGYLFRTRTGELTIHVEQLTFLAKAMLALPEKFHGLADVELRYRQRYVDLFANLDAREVFVKRAKVLRALRTFFDEPRLSRSGNADDAADRRRRGGAALHHPPQRARSWICFCASRRSFI